MGRLKDFSIFLDNNKTVFSSGETVTGKCIVDLRSDVKLRGLRIYMKGLATVHWSEQRGITSTGAYTQKFDAEEEYFNMHRVLFGKDEDEEGSNPTLQSGHHEFAFRFQIPPGHVATSFEGKYGRVRYWLKAELDRPWGFNSRTKKAFTVIDHIDINIPALLTPVGGSRDKDVCCCFCRSGPINLAANTDRRGYCPGESIAISAQFENYSTKKLTPKATLYQRTVFYAGGKSRSVRNGVVTIRGEGVAAGRVGTWDNRLMRIPPVTPSLVNCGIIKVEYILTVFLDISAAMNLYLHLPIVVGTVPLRAPPYSHHDPLTPPGGLAQPSLPHITPVAPPMNELPPSYADCIFGAADICEAEERDGHTFGPTSYTPMYTYVRQYHFVPPPPPPQYTRDDPRSQPPHSRISATPAPTPSHLQNSQTEDSRL